MKVKVILELEHKPFVNKEQFEYAIKESLIRYIDGGEIIEIAKVRNNNVVVE